MLRRFEVKNYRNFKESLVFDFGKVGGYQFSEECIEKGIIAKALLYGRNATGKTNLGHAMMDISEMLFLPLELYDENFLNADSQSGFVEFCYEFQFDNHILVYSYSKIEDGYFRDEKLYIDRKCVFSCDFQNRNYRFDNLELIDAETISVDRYLQSLDTENDAGAVSEHRLSFLRWVLGYAALKKDSISMKLSDYVLNMGMITVGNATSFRSKRMYEKFFEILADKKELKRFEEFLNEMGIECELTWRKLPDGKNELYFKHERLIPFYSTASSGTIALMNLYRRLIAKKGNVSFLYIDEFDAFYHYEMAENLIKFLKKEFTSSQIVLTTHNTNLMTNRLFRPDCLFILSRSGKITALCNATERELREGHNLEKMYISGEFEEYE